MERYIRDFLSAAQDEAEHYHDVTVTHEKRKTHDSVVLTCGQLSRFVTFAHSSNGRALQNFRRDVKKNLRDIALPKY